MPTPTRPLARLRSSLASMASTVRGRLPVWDARGAIGDAADAASWPFERAAWAIERGLIWPLQRRFGGWDLAMRALAAGAVAIVAVAAGVAGLLWADARRQRRLRRHASGAGSRRDRGEAAGVRFGPPLEPRPARRRSGVRAPKAGSGGAAKVASEKAVRAPASTPPAPPAPPTSAAASISSAPGIVGKPAGPAALAVARQFSDAFVLYETGQGNARVRAAFGSTATPALAQSLLRRPPRQPASVRVPKAKVLNVVAGPSSGGVYTVSVSLLRVGLTSELRLEMEKAKHGKWHVTDVLG